MVNYLAMLTIKLSRIGKKNQPSFRVIVSSGKRIIENLGYYYPYSQPPRFQVEKARLEYWRKSGARLTSAISALLKGKYEFKAYAPKKEVETLESAVPSLEKSATEPAATGEAPTEVPPVEAAPKEEANA